MTAPKDPKEKPRITLDLDLKVEPERNKRPPIEETKPQFKSLNVTVIRPENPKPQTPRNVKSGVIRPLRTRPKRKPFKINPIALLAGVLIAGFLLSTYIGSFPSKVAPEHVPAPAPAATKPAEPVQTDPIPANPKPEVTVTDPNQGIREAQLSQLGTEIDSKGNTSFAVRIKPKAVCFPGDVEAMRNVFGNTGSVLLSLEPMAEGNNKAPAVTRTISIKEVMEGVKVSLPVNLKETGVYGIYICGDAEGTRHCGGKKPADFNRILNFKDLDVASNAVYYYQFSVIGLDYATLYTGMPNGIGAARDQLTQKKPNKDWKPQLDKAASLMRGVKSLPPKTTIESNVVTMELQLAMMGGKNCR